MTAASAGGGGAAAENFLNEEEETDLEDSRRTGAEIEFLTNHVE